MIGETIPAGELAGAALLLAMTQISTARHKPRIFEMFGIPGVGKTTLAKAVVRDGAHVTRTQLTTAWKRLPLWRQAVFVLRALIDLRCVISAARFAVGARLAGNEGLARLVRLIVKAHWMKSQRGTLVLDQSFLQEIWSIAVSAGRHDPDRQVLARLIRCLYSGLQVQILFVEADSTTAARRIASRASGYSRLDGLTPDEAEAQLTKTARLPHAIIAAATAAGLPVERVDGSHPIEANASRLHAILAATGLRHGDG